MNKITKVVLSVAIVIALGGAYLFPQVQGVINLGANPGPDFYDHLVFKQGFTTGGTALATSTAESTVTMTSATLRPEITYISWTVNLDTTVTTMASTSAPFSNLAVGEKLEVLVYSATTTAATTLTWAAGTGVDLQEDEGETVIQNGLEIARLTFVKKANTDVLMWVEVGQVGD